MMNLKTSLPERWVWCSLDDLISALESGGRPKGGVKDIQSGIPSIGGEHLNDEGSFRFDKIRYIPESYFAKMHKGIIKRKDILMVKDGATTGKTSYVDDNFTFDKAAVNEHVFILRSFPESVEQRYLFRYLFSKEGQIEIQKKFQGSAQGGINTKFIMDFPVPLSPIPEQRLIVARLDSLLEHARKAKESLEKIPRIMKHFRQAALKKAFSGELTAEWRAQQQDLEPAAKLLKRIQEERKHHYEEEVRRAKAEGRKLPKKQKYLEIDTSDISNLSELPEGWIWTKFLFMVDSLKNGIYKQIEFYGSGTPCLRMYNIENAKIVWKNIHHMKLTSSEIEEYGLKPNDILINRVNSRELVGKAAIIPEGLGDVVFESKNIRMRVDLEIINPKHVVNFLQTKFARDQIEIEAKQTVGMATISQEDILEWFIPLPPLKEQQEIVRCIESLFKFADETEKNAAEARKRVELMTQSILSRAFRGDLTADFREAVKNWKGLDAEARRRYLFMLPADERETVLNADEFPMEPASELLRRIGEEKAKMERKSSKPRLREQKQKLPYFPL